MSMIILQVPTAFVLRLWRQKAYRIVLTGMRELEKDSSVEKKLRRLVKFRRREMTAKRKPKIKMSLMRVSLRSYAILISLFTKVFYEISLRKEVIRKCLLGYQMIRLHLLHS